MACSSSSWPSASSTTPGPLRRKHRVPGRGVRFRHGDHDPKGGLAWLRDNADDPDEFNRNLIALGDFNIDRRDDPNWHAFVSAEGPLPPYELLDLPRTVGGDAPEALALRPDRLVQQGQARGAHAQVRDRRQLRLGRPSRQPPRRGADRDQGRPLAAALNHSPRGWDGPPVQCAIWAVRASGPLPDCQHPPRERTQGVGARRAALSRVGIRSSTPTR